MGAYGGKYADIFPTFSFSGILLSTSKVSMGLLNKIGMTVKKTIKIGNQSSDSGNFDSVVVANNKKDLLISYSISGILGPLQSDSISIEWTPANDIQFLDTILVYHKIPSVVNPIKIAVTGKAKIVNEVENSSTCPSIQIFPNPVRESAIVQYSGLAANSRLLIIDIQGKIIKCDYNLASEGQIVINSREIPNGTYFYKFNSDNKFLSGKILVVK
jgi:hypothetical protein